jgi:dTDP-4-dehydrorhamnose reductase
MKILIYGSNGFIGKKLINYIKNNHNYIIIEGKSRCENIKDVEEEINEYNPDRIISCIGRSSGKNIY